jgi:hypothetical protein
MMHNSGGSRRENALPRQCGTPFASSLSETPC